MRKSLKPISLVFFLLFLSAAMLQWNDPDPWIWVVLYGIAALVSLFYFFGRRHLWISLVLGVVYLIWAVVLWPDTWEGINLGEGNMANIERARESLGLIIMGFVMFLYAVFKPRTS